MIKACAILATYNEADIIEESVKKLIDAGIEVFVIDNGSTDRTLDIVSPLVGRGVVDIRTVKFHEDGREVYDWTSILRMKEGLSRELGFDWYLHVDADEIRYSPWPHLSLREGLDRVDRSGYNLVNFKLFNFRLTHDIAVSENYERDMPEYSVSEDFNHYQVKAWKSHPEIDIAAYGGHIARRPGALIYPTRFIHKHYPVRSLEHGRRKILQERKQRFSRAEKQRGWHVQYDQLEDVQAQDVFWKSGSLVKFEMHTECLNLLEEGADVASTLLALANGDELEVYLERGLVNRFSPSPFSREHAQQLLGVARQLFSMTGQGPLPPIESSPAEIDYLRCALHLLAAKHWLTGDASSFQRSASINLKPV